jgi:hypothetical protein
MLSKNVYQELFLRYAECSLDEEILTFKKKKREFLSKVENSLILTQVILQSKENFLTLNSKTCNDFYSEIWISNDLRFAESNFINLFLKAQEPRVFFPLLTLLDRALERMNVIYERLN